MTDKYQVMPPLNDQEYQELKNSIAQHGVQVAVEYDEDGSVLDGHHRLQACKELRIQNIPKVVKVGMNEQQKLDYALMVNTTRRQLSREQKQELIRQQLKRTPEKSDRQIAEMVGTDHKTVGFQRKDLAGRGEIPHTDKVVDSLGREQPRQNKPVTLYQPDEKSISDTKKFTQTAAPEFVNATAEGKITLKDAVALAGFIPQSDQTEAVRRVESGEADSIMDGLDQAKEKRRGSQPKPYYADQESVWEKDQKLINNTNNAFYSICEKMHYLNTDYSNIARCLLAAGNDRDELVNDLNDYIERFQCIKAALSKSNKTFLKAVK